MNLDQLLAVVERRDALRAEIGQWMTDQGKRGELVFANQHPRWRDYSEAEAEYGRAIHKAAAPLIRLARAAVAWRKIGGFEERPYWTASNEQLDEIEAALGELCGGNDSPDSVPPTDPSASDTKKPQ